jgi:hypothetical protein
MLRAKVIKTCSAVRIFSELNCSIDFIAVKGTEGDVMFEKPSEGMEGIPDGTAMVGLRVEDEISISGAPIAEYVALPRKNVIFKRPRNLRRLHPGKALKIPIG